jgi:hypothetical protein
MIGNSMSPPHAGVPRPRRLSLRGVRTFSVDWTGSRCPESARCTTVPQKRPLAAGDVIALTDEDADVVEAKVLAVDGSDAAVQADWDAEPPEDQGRTDAERRRGIIVAWLAHA